MKHSSYYAAAIAILSTSLTLTACLRGGGDDLSDEDYDDVAVAVGSLVADSSGGGEAGSMNDTLTVIASGSAAARSAEGASSTEIVIHAGLQYEYRLDCYDAGGQLQDACGETTDRADVSVTWSGDLSLPTYSAAVARDGDWSLSGLQSGTATFNGTGSFDIETHFTAMYRPITRDLSLSYQADYDAIAIDMATGRIQSGEIRYQIAGEADEQRGDVDRNLQISVDAEVEFLGDGTALLTLDGSHAYTVNTATGQVSEGQ